MSVCNCVYFLEFPVICSVFPLLAETSHPVFSAAATRWHETGAFYAVSVLNSSLILKGAWIESSCSYSILTVECCQRNRCFPPAGPRLEPADIKKWRNPISCLVLSICFKCKSFVSTAKSRSLFVFFIAQIRGHAVILWCHFYSQGQKKCHNLFLPNNFFLNHDTFRSIYV